MSTALQLGYDNFLPAPSKEADRKVADMLRKAALRPNTYRAYESAWRGFENYCRDIGTSSLPAQADTVCMYIGYCVKNRVAPSTITVVRSAIGKIHRIAKEADPTDDDGVRATMRGVPNLIGAQRPAEKQAPLLTEQIRALVAALPDTITGTRDRAIILLGFAGCMRRSEIVRLTVKDLKFNDKGVRVRFRGSKTDRAGKGQSIGILRTESEFCPVAAVETWLQTGKITSGPVFRHIVRPFGRSFKVTDKPLTAQSVRFLLLKACESAGIDITGVSAHSLRAGGITQMFLNGAPLPEVQRISRHKNTDVLLGYYRAATVFQNNATAFLGL